MDKDQNFKILAIRRRTTFMPPDARTDSWIKPRDFLMTALSSNLGVSFFWNTPYKSSKHGGIVFILIYILMQLVVGVPKLLLDMALGQFTSQGSLTCWSFAPLFSGIGFAGLLTILCSSLFNFEILSWVVFYLINTIMETELPWTKCQSPWKTRNCRNLAEICKRSFVWDKDCEPCGYHWNASDGTCRAPGNNKTVTVFNVSTARKITENEILSARNYFHYYVSDDEVMEVEHSHDEHSHSNNMKCRILLCLVFCLIVIAVLLRSSIHWIGRMARYSSTVPFVLLLLLLAFGIGKEGAFEGIKIFLTPSVHALTDKEAWLDAALHTFVSLSLGSFNLINYASYNKFDREILNDAFALPAVETAYSILTGLVIFSYFGYMKHTEGLDFKAALTQKNGAELPFVYFPMALSLLDLPRFWSILYFSSMFILSMALQVTILMSVIICLQDRFETVREWELGVRVSLCLLFFFGGIPMIFLGKTFNLKVFLLLSSYENAFVIVLFQCFAVAYVYGGKRFMTDLECMIDVQSKKFVPWFLRRWRVVYLSISWYITCPIFAIMFIIIGSTGNDGYQRIELRVLAVFVRFSSVIVIFGYMLYIFYHTQGSFKKRLSKLLTAEHKWGPPRLADQLTVRQKRKTLRNIELGVNGSDSEEESSTEPIPRFQYAGRNSLPLTL